MAERNERVDKVVSEIFQTNLSQSQFDAIEAFLGSFDVLALFPSVDHKMIYQVSAAVRSGVTVVITPLLSIAHKESRELMLKGINSFLYSVELIQGFQDGSIITPKILFVTPEQLNSSALLMVCLKKWDERSLLESIVILNAHSVSMMGSDFRSDYLSLSKFRSQLGSSVPFQALSIPVSLEIRGDIVQNLLNQDCQVLFGDLHLSNLYLSVKKTKGRLLSSDLIQFLKGSYPPGNCGIIYCLSRRDCESVCESLLGANFNVSFYHSGVPQEERQTRAEEWSRGNIDIMVGTLAFTGITKRDLRFVIHFEYPRSLSNLFFDVVAVGGDGVRSDCVIFCPAVSRMPHLLHEERMQKDFAEVVHFCNNQVDCRQQMLLQAALGNKSGFSVNKACEWMCDNCDNQRGKNIKGIKQPK